MNIFISSFRANGKNVNTMFVLRSIQILFFFARLHSALVLISTADYDSMRHNVKDLKTQKYVIENTCFSSQNQLTAIHSQLATKLTRVRIQQKKKMKKKKTPELNRRMVNINIQYTIFDPNH